MLLIIILLFLLRIQKPIMIVGSHELTGQVVPLKQAFCVLEKKEGYEIRGIVTQKILFDKYPKTILR